MDDENFLRSELDRLMGKPVVPTVMPFGKYRGQEFAKMPSGYLRWMFGTTQDKGLRIAINKELETREHE